MEENKQLFEQQASQIVRDIKASFDQKDLVATGESKNSIRYEANDKGFIIFGGSHIENVELGRGPATGGSSGGAFLKRLEKWIKLRGLEIKPESLKYLINKFGTRQYQKGGSNGVISDVVNQQLVDTLVEDSKAAQISKLKNAVQAKIKKFNRN